MSEPNKEGDTTTLAGPDLVPNENYSHDCRQFFISLGVYQGLRRRDGTNSGTDSRQR